MKKSSLPRLTVTLTREKLPLMAYLAGVMIGDGDLHGGRGRLRVKDENFARAVAEKLSKLIGRDIMVRQQKDGFYCLENVVLGYVKRGLWKILAYIDRYGERYFLSGLLDAEASISPHLRDKKEGHFHLQINFTNTDLELVRYVESSLRELGLKPKIRVIRHGNHVINGKLAVRKKPLYSVYAAVMPSKASALTRIELHCRKKELLVCFFLAVKDLPPRSRYLIFLRYWKKVGSRWEPVNDDLLEQVKSYSIERQTSRHKPRARITRTCAVVCPRCGRKGALLFHRMEDGKRVLVHVYVLHEDEGPELCELDTIEGRIEEGKKIATFVCKKCGRLGRFYPAVHKVARRVYVRIWHYANGKLEWCILVQLRLLEAEPDQRSSEC